MSTSGRSGIPILQKEEQRPERIIWLKAQIYAQGTQKATAPVRLPGLSQDRCHSLAGHLSPSLQDEAGTVLILKKERRGEVFM